MGAGDLVVTELGSGEALVVFVHGVLGSGRSFDRVAGVLVPDCRMLLYDLAAMRHRRAWASRRGSSDTSTIWSPWSTVGTRSWWATRSVA